MKIELERSYQRLNDGTFELYTPPIQLTENNNFRPIYPKIQLYKVFIQFTNNPELISNNLQVSPHFLFIYITSTNKITFKNIIQQLFFFLFYFL